MKSYESTRHRMVETQIASRGVRDPRVLGAMRDVPRERFVPEALLEFAYEDTPLPIEEGQTISQPYIVAVMAETLQLAPSDRVLEVGAGSGYAAAVLGRAAGEVYAIERHPLLAELARQRVAELGYDNVTILCGDGTLGSPEHAPFDAIAVAAGGPEVPRALLEQLKIGGRLVIPVGADLRSQELRTAVAGARSVCPAGGQRGMVAGRHARGPPPRPQTAAHRPGRAEEAECPHCRKL
jgi:protein-L-isoaspartate(D-aspartate) O-methyltransferase